MSRQVQIAAGKSHVVLPNGGAYDAGAVVTLSDEEWSLIPARLVPGTIIDQGSVKGAGSHQTQVAGNTATNIVLPNGANAQHGDSYPLTERQYAAMTANAKSTTTATPNADKVSTLSVPVNLASLANGRVFQLTPGQPNSLPYPTVIGPPQPLVQVPQNPGRILAFDAITLVPGTGTGATATLSLTISGTAVTGGSLVLSLASQSAAGNITTASAITAANVFTATNYISVEAAAVTAFTAGRALLRITILSTAT